MKNSSRHEKANYFAIKAPMSQGTKNHVGYYKLILEQSKTQKLHRNNFSKL